jgi:hypothetical protein
MFHPFYLLLDPLLSSDDVSKPWSSLFEIHNFLISWQVLILSWGLVTMWKPLCIFNQSATQTTAMQYEGNCTNIHQVSTTLYIDY